MKKNFWKEILKDKEKLYYIGAGIVFFVAIIFLVYFLVKEKPGVENIFSPGEDIVTTSTDHIFGCEHKSGLTGECVLTENEQFVPLVGVMIENFVSARPQAGVAGASVVYEAPAEGNITRFLALFPKDAEIEKAGPIRSSRPYYLDFISEYPGAMYMHVGGSPEALEKIPQYKIFAMNEFYRSLYFWRDDKKEAPHNTYTSSDLWQGAYDRYADKTINPSFEPWNFSASSSRVCVESCVTQIEIPFSLPSYIVKWKYNPELKIFERYHSVNVHVDEKGTPVKANTVIVQHVTDKILDDVGRRALGVVGEGKAEVYVYGEKFEGTWKKDSRTSRTKFFDAAGNEMPLAPGKIWVEIVPQNIKVSNLP